MKLYVYISEILAKSDTDLVIYNYQMGPKMENPQLDRNFKVALRYQLSS